MAGCQGGVHVKAPNGTPLANAMLTILNALGLDDLSSSATAKEHSHGHDPHTHFAPSPGCPGWLAVVILSLGVGIGVNTAVFTWIQTVLLRPLPGVAGGGSFYHLEAKAETGTFPGSSWLEYQDLAARRKRSRGCWRFAWRP